MALHCRESVNSPSPRSDGSIDRTWIVEGTTDDAQAEQEVLKQAPTAYRGNIRAALPDTKPVQRGIWEVTYSYALPDSNDDPNNNSDEPQGDEPTLGTLEMDGSGGTEHVTQCLSQKAFPASGIPVPQEIVDRKIVGLHKDGVNGVDIDAPGSIWTVTKKWLPQAITGDYLQNLSYLRAKTNSAPYTLRWGYKGTKYQVEFPVGELRYLTTKATTTLTRRGVGVFEISYSMVHAKNRSNIKIADGSAGIIIPEKRAHDYLWMLYRKETLTGSYKATIETPECAFVSKMYEEDDFKSVLKF